MDISSTWSIGNNEVGPNLWCESLLQSVTVLYFLTTNRQFKGADP
jgi:hypothetical protein